MITESYCSFEISKLLKKKGFDIHCDRGWDISCYDVKQSRMFSHGFDSKENWISSPTHQMACAWLREKGVYIEIGIVITTDDKVYYHANVGTITDAWKLVDEWNDSYENSVEAALKYVLENLI